MTGMHEFETAELIKLRMIAPGEIFLARDLIIDNPKRAYNAATYAVTCGDAEHISRGVYRRTNRVASPQVDRIAKARAEGYTEGYAAAKRELSSVKSS